MTDKKKPIIGYYVVKDHLKEAHPLTKGESIREVLRKDIIDSVDLYFAPLKAVARQFSKSLDAHSGENRSKHRHAR